MAIAVSIPSIERALGVRLRDMTADTFHQLVVLGMQEDRQVEFKREIDLGGSARAEITKDICAMANALGGVIFFGIEEEEGRAARLVPQQLTAGDLRDRLAQIVRSHSRPAPAFEIEVYPSEGGSFAAIAVPRSVHAPHAVIRTDRSDPWLQFPVRYESTTRFMDESELASRYIQRTTLTASREADLEKLIGTVQPHPSQISIALAVVPWASGISEISASSGEQVSDRVARHFASGESTMGIELGLRPTEVTIKPRSIEVRHPTGAFDLADDGSMLAVFHLDPFVAANAGRVVGRPAGILDETLTAMVMAGFEMSALHTHGACGCVGDGLAGVRILARNQDGTPRHLGLVSAASAVRRGQRRMIGTTTEEVHVSTQVSLDDVASGGRRSILALHRLMSQMCRHFGLPESTTTSGDGTIRMEGISAENAGLVHGWAERSGVVAL